MYDYRSLQKDVARFERYAKTGSIGRTVEGREIPYVFLGSYGEKQLIVQGGMHAREHISSALVAMLAERYLANPQLLKRTGVWFLPMTNPDGVELAIHGLGTASESRREFLRCVNGGSVDFSLWKANAAAVDLNNNFPARWGRGEGQKQVPAPSAYVGKRSASEPETQALMRLTRFVKPALTVSYHSKGEAIYWEFHERGEERKRNAELARALSAETGYELLPAGRSTGGYKDYCIEKRAIPAFTVEVGRDELPHPVPDGELGLIYRQNRRVLEALRERI